MIDLAVKPVRARDGLIRRICGRRVKRRRRLGGGLARELGATRGHKRGRHRREDIGKSFEELRLEDYELGRDAGKWWIGGTLQINNDRDMAAALDALQLGLPSDSNSVEYPTYGFPILDNEGNIVT